MGTRRDGGVRRRIAFDDVSNGVELLTRIGVEELTTL
jgi:hypothetical protein